MTTRNFLQHDCQTNKMKIATHVRFDEGLSGLPLKQLPSNVSHLLCSEEGNQQSLEDMQADIADHEL